ncbi:MAG: prolyl oligopeptidase family serine peptidase [Paenibacillaceae bacterium]|nr:prolyl oligopeptidase family serine peptidase [Paenibacillaceae bacterium]
METAYPPYEYVQDTIDTAVGPVVYELGIPRQPAPDCALLLNVAMDRERTVRQHPYSILAECLQEQGHYTLSFDLPCHGAWACGGGEGIVGIAAAVAAGGDPFADFIAVARAILTRVLSGRAAACRAVYAGGTSRGAYFALRLAAVDARITRIAAMAPVTDWRELREFAAIRERADVAALALCEYIPALLGKSVFMTIGYADGRVSTARCAQFYVELHERNRGLHDDAGRGEGRVVLLITEDEGHQLEEKRYRQGAAFLLKPF